MVKPPLPVDEDGVNIVFVFIPCVKNLVSVLN